MGSDDGSACPHTAGGLHRRPALSCPRAAHRSDIYPGAAANGTVGASGTAGLRNTSAPRSTSRRNGGRCSTHPDSMPWCGEALDNSPSLAQATAKLKEAQEEGMPEPVRQNILR